MLGKGQIYGDIVYDPAFATRTTPPSSDMIETTFNARTTCYDLCYFCCEKTKDNPAWGRTASGIVLAGGERVVAADSSLSFGTWLYIDGLGYYMVADRGGAIKDKNGYRRLDIFMGLPGDKVGDASRGTAGRGGSGCWNAPGSYSRVKTTGANSGSVKVAIIKKEYCPKELSTNDNNKKGAKDKFIFVGDSRFVGMETYKTEKDKFVCKTSEGLSYFKRQEATIKSAETDNSVVIIGLGVNDLGADNYVQYVNSLSSSLKSQIYFLTVNPVEESKANNNGYSRTNSEIDAFNTTIKNNAKDYKIIDTNSYLKENGYTTVDGLHYDSATYKKIYNYIKSQIN